MPICCAGPGRPRPGVGATPSALVEPLDSLGCQCGAQADTLPADHRPAAFTVRGPVSQPMTLLTLVPRASSPPSARRRCTTCASAGERAHYAQHETKVVPIAVVVHFVDVYVVGE